MNATIEKQLVEILTQYPKVKLCYLFGSHARNDAGPISDYDFAIYLDENNSSKRFDLKLELIAKFAKRLNTDSIDLVVLNDLEAPELKYNIIKEGRLIYDIEPYRVLIEPKIMNEFFDFRDSLRHNGLTKA